MLHLSDLPNSSEVRIQVRTFEGSTLRSSFPRTATIATHVRPWIDSNAEHKTPYNLKIILTPLPTRTVEAAEEEKSLDDLDIIGSCTLVMVPVKGFVERETNICVDRFWHLHGHETGRASLDANNTTTRVVVCTM